MVQTSVSSRRIRNEYAQHLRKYFWKPYFWNRAYAVISVGGRANIETLLKYIQHQDEPARLKPPTDNETRRVPGATKECSTNNNLF